jgi:hypothetical protein
MWLWTTATAEFGEEEGFKKFTENLKGAIENSLDVNIFRTFFVDLNKEATKLQRELSGGMGGYGAQLEKQIHSIMKSNLDLGITMDEIVGYASTWADETGRIPSLQDNVIGNMKALSTMTGLGVKELTKYVAEFDKVGMGQEQAQKGLVKIAATAKGFGLNSKALTADVMKNIEKTNTYQFKGGVEGLTKMAARARQLGFDFEKVMAIGEDALDPDRAIEMASGMQMLGGQVGALGDPFKLLYMAQNDLGALQDEFIKVTAASAEYNKETGEFKIGTQQMYRLKAMAKELGISYEEISKSAIKARKEQEIMSEVNFGAGTSEEDKQLLASMAEKKEGEWKIKLPGTEDWVKVQDAANLQMGKIKEMQVDMNKSSDDLLRDLGTTAKSQLSLSEQQTIELRKVTTASIFGKAGQDEIDARSSAFNAATNSYVETFGSATTTFKEQIEITKKTYTTLNTEANTIMTFFVDGLANGTAALRQYTSSIGGLALYIQETKNKLSNALTPLGDPDAQGVQQDVFIPSSFKGKNIVKGDFGQFTTNPKDDFLAAPNIGEFLNDAQGAFSILNNMDNMNVAKLGNLQDLLTKNVNLDQLSKVVNVNTTSTNEVKGDVGVNGEVKLKIEGLNGSLANILESDTNFQRMFKENVMNIVNERLSKSYSEKLGNL